MVVLGVAAISIERDTPVGPTEGNAGGTWGGSYIYDNELLGAQRPEIPVGS